MTLRSAIKAVRVAFLVTVVLYAVTGVGLLGPGAQQQNLKAGTAALAAFSAFIQGQAARYFAAHPIVPPVAASLPAHKHPSASH